jgi:1-acyl-sn-glycerol-3-phosphate acyltransferase
MATPGVILRSSLFACLLLLLTPPYTVVSLLILPLPARTRWRIVTSWSRLVVAAATGLCGIRYRVKGHVRPHDGPFIVLAKHQSAWETLALQAILPPHVWVVKKQLLWLPFFGWGLATLLPIAIDRAAGVRSLKQILAQGRDRLARGFWIVIYPEGTRVRPGERKKYQVGGAWLASHTSVPVVPVAHNAGHLWPRGSFLKFPGEITVSIGTPIPTAGRKPEEINREVEAWIEQEMTLIGPAGQPR